MLQQREIVTNAALDMMRRILVQECAIQRIRLDSANGEKLACAIMTAYLGGATNPAELRTVARTRVYE